jgi:mono/diheme cytochrome c family protein/glucose/arabinose dehydrogenase
MTTRSSRRLWLAAGAALVVTIGFTPRVFTQDPAQEGQPAPAAPAGRGGGGRGAVQPGGRGPAIGSQGGQMVADPANANMDFSPKTPIVALSPEEEKKHFILPPGYDVDLVLDDQSVISPAAMAFDADGRMYIAEMRTFMRDADGTGQLDPVSRVSLHESTKHDGVFDRHTVFVDHLVLPRMLLPLDKGLLVNETHSDDVVLYTDTNGDGVADKRQIFFSGIGSNRDGNVQHEQSGLIWGLDNWIYSTYNAFRIRWTPNGIVREPSGSSGAEWGASMDDDGRMWFVNSGGERGPVAFQTPIAYGAFNTPDQLEPGFESVYGAPSIGDMQGGAPRVRMPYNNLNHLTSSSAPEIVRSDRYPQDMQGDLLFCEFVARSIRRAKVVRSEGLTQLKNAYQGAEFLTSTDPLFRPINIKTGPDGALYILDWYQGIIQDANWTGRGTYLRTKIEQYGLDHVTNHGRVWRLRFVGIPGNAPASAPQRPGVPAIELSKTWPHMSDETPAQLVAHLTSPIGWWRDTAQRLLVLRQDKSAVPELVRLARSRAEASREGGDNTLGRIHALWTLEGLGALDVGLARELMKDANARVRAHAIRASETLYKAGNRTLDADYRAALKDADPDVAVQAMLTLNTLKVPDAAAAIKNAQETNKARGLKVLGDMILAPPAAGRGGGRGGAVLSPEQQQQIQQGGEVYGSLCFSCHSEDGRGRPLAGAADGAMMAPSLAGSPRVNGHRDYVVKVLLKGITGPLGDAKYSEVMVPMGTNTDAWIASVASYVRTSFGNAGGFVTPADVARVRASIANRKTPWTLTELEATLPHRLDPSPDWKVTASHNSAAAAPALAMMTWSSGAPQAPGMWFQIELPQPAMLTEIEFDSPAAGGRGGGAAGQRGGRGADAGAPAAAPAVPAPHGYKVEVSMDGAKWSAKPVAEGKGVASHTSVTFAPVRTKFIRITQTDPAADAGGAVWTMSNVRLHEAGK